MKSNFKGVTQILGANFFRPPQKSDKGTKKIL